MNRYDFVRTLGMCAVLGACSRSAPNASGEPTGRVQSALAVDVSAPFQLEAFPALTEGSAATAVLGCVATSCLALFQDITNGYSGVFATRVTSSGAVVDRPQLLLSAADYGIATAVVPQGTSFLAVWTEGGFSDPVRNRAVRISAATGAVLADLSSAMPQDQVMGAFTAGSTILFILRSGSAYSAVFLKASDLTPVGTSSALGRGMPDVVLGNGQYLLTWNGFSQRFDASTGAALDASPTEFSRYVSGPVDGVFANGAYQLAFGSGSTVYAARIRASDGAALDPDDTFNQLPGPKSLCTGCLQSGTRVHVTLLASDPLVIWQGTGTEGARINVTSGGRLTGTNAGPEFDLGTSLPVLDLQPLPGGETLINVDGAGLTRLDVTPSPLSLSIPQGVQLAPHSVNRGAPLATSNGTDFFVAWTENDQLHGTRVDGRTGAYLDDPPLDIAVVPNSNFAVASDGTNYMVAWVAGNRIRRRALGRDGTLGPEILPELNPVDTAGAPRLTWNGAYYLATWVAYAIPQNTIVGVRLSQNGDAVDTSPAVFGSGTQGRYVVAADTVPPASTRTFYVAWDSNTPLVRLYRSELGVLIQPIQNLPVYVAPVLFTNGSDVLVTGINSGSTPIAAFIDSGTGASSSPVRLTDVVPAAQPTAAIFDGKSYLIVLGGGTAVKRYGTDLAALDRALPSGAPLVSRIDQPCDIATNGKGRSLFACANHEMLRFGYAVTGRFIDDDGEATPDAGAGAGGAGGVPSGGGAPSSGGSPTGDASSSGGASGGGGTSGGASGAGTGGAGPASSGGTSSAGGLSSSGGTPPGGGTSQTGGSVGTGGAVTDAGVGEGTGSARSGEAAGCGCSLPTRGTEQRCWSVAVGAALLARRRRRRSDRPKGRE